jgi:L-ascorbate metabolism protein UlaG (beta-lactamase superfamily)
MGPDDAAYAVKLLGAGQAVPVHYAHNPLVVGPQCGDLFKAAVARATPQTAVTLLRPGETKTLQIATNAR